MLVDDMWSLRPFAQFMGGEEGEVRNGDEKVGGFGCCLGGWVSVTGMEL